MVRRFSELPLAQRYQMLLRCAAFMTWLHAYLIMQITDPGLKIARSGTGWVIAWCTLLPLFWLCTATEPDQVQYRRLLILAELAATFSMRWCVPRNGIFFLLLLITWQVVMYFSLREALAWMSVQFLLHCASLHFEHRLNSLNFLAALVYLAFKMLTCGMVIAALREADEKSKQSAAIADLKLRQTVLVESSRSAERLRISRDLHDGLGHGLTALSLHLEVALNEQSSEAAHAQLHKARAVAKRMLNDVREVVGELQDATRIRDLSDVIAELTSNVPGLDIHVRKPDSIRLESEDQVVAAMRCIQEIVTNTLKHARAQNLWLNITLDDEQLCIRSFDDGLGLKARKTEGTGLRGMRERFRRLGGDVTVLPTDESGFAINAFLPVTILGGAR